MFLPSSSSHLIRDIKAAQHITKFMQANGTAAGGIQLQKSIHYLVIMLIHSNPQPVEGRKDPLIIGFSPLFVGVSSCIIPIPTRAGLVVDL